VGISALYVFTVGGRRPSVTAVLALDDPADAATAGPPPLADPRQLYGHWYYETSCGLRYDDNDHWREFFGRIADNIVALLAPTRVLDAGCAKGFLVAALRERGVDAEGFDLSEVAIAAAPEAARPHVRVGYLTDPLEPIEPSGARYDLATCIEVIEHLDPVDAPAAVANLCEVADRVLFSSSPGDLHEATHVNVQPQERWSQLFAAQGFYRDFRHDASYLTPWAAVYRRAEPSIGELVLDYDRAWYQLRAETLEQRRALLQAEARLGAMSRLADQEVVDRLEGECADLRKEVLRLRDALIGREAELGTTLGRLAEVQARLHRSLDAEAHLHRVLRSRSWRLVWSMGRPVRTLRRRRS